MELLQAVLEKYERSQDSITGELSGNISYRVQDSLYRRVPKQQIAAEAGRLEEAGLCRIKWVNGYHGIDVELIRYPRSSIPEFYRMEGKVPRYERIRQCCEEIKAALEQVSTPWIRRCLEQLLQNAEAGRMEERQDFRQGILACLMELDELTEPMFHRVFSRKVFQDSKCFERNYQKEVCRLARTFYPEAVSADMSEKEVLEQIYIDDYSQELMLKGDIQIEMAGRWADLSLFLYGVTLNAQTIKSIHGIRAEKIHRVITIENKANYLAEQVEEDTLVIFSHGYFSPLERSFLEQLKNSLPPDTAYFHSGDMDYGGVCIFRYIRERIFPGLQPWKMSAELLERCRRTGRTEPLKQEKWEKLKQTEEPVLQPLITYMLEQRVQMEQEELLVGGTETYA